MHKKLYQNAAKKQTITEFLKIQIKISPAIQLIHDSTREDHILRRSLAITSEGGRFL